MSTTTLPLAVTLASAFLWAALGLAQDAPKPKDEALDKLLEKIDVAKSSSPARPEATPDAKPAAGLPGRETVRPASDLAPKDKALDNLLEKLGETRETPAPDDKPPPGHGPAETPPAPAEKPGPADLKGKEKNLDQHLEELTGRKHKKKEQDGQGSGPLAEVIKEMREVEKRLGKPDTGEETRKKQTEIVKHLDTLIEQLRASSSQSPGKKKYLAMKPGSKPGSKPGGDTPGAMSGQAPNAKPQKPTGIHSLAGGKDAWGHLPPELRQDMDNVFKEEALPLKAELIRRYYLSLSKKTLLRGE